MKRRAFAATAARNRFLVPSVRKRFVTASSRSRFRTPADGEMAVISCTTTSGAARATAVATASASKASATIGSAPAEPIVSALLAVRVIPWTEWPAESRMGKSCRPMAPLAPATNTLIRNPYQPLRRFAECRSSRERGLSSAVRRLPFWRPLICSNAAGRGMARGLRPSIRTECRAGDGTSDA